MKLQVFKILTAPFRSKPIDPTPVCNQRGQAVIEYILLLVISVSVILGGFYQLNSAFRKLTDKMFGVYVACLLEAGELPGEGGLCEARLKIADEMDLGSGTYGGGPGGSSGGGSGGSSGGNTGGGSGGGSDGSSGSGSGGRGGIGSGSNGRGGQGGRGNAGQSEKTNPTARSSSSSSSSSGSGAGGGANRFSSSNDFGKKMNRNKGGESVELSEQEASETAKSGKGYRSANSGATGTTTSAFDQSVGRLRYIPMGSEDQKVEEKAEKIEINDADKKRANRKIALSEDGRKTESGPELDGNITLPNFIRYFLIAAIFIVIVFFLGGQAMAFKKGQEKS